MPTKSKLFEGQIKDLTQSGLGVVNGPDGCVYFVSGTWPGDVGTFEITSQKKTYGFAKLISIQTKSEHRVEDIPCRFHGTEDGTCGGCPWIPFSYEDQIKRKNALVEYAMQKSKLFGDSGTLKPTIASPSALGYRNRAQLKTNGIKLGFVSHQNKTLVDVEHCVVLNDECSRRLKDLRTKLPNTSWIPKKKYLWNFIDINDTTDWDLEVLNLNERLPFVQGNHAQNDVMKSWLKSNLANIEYPQTVIELFCGSGNFTETLSKSPLVSSVLAAEFSHKSIEELKLKKFPNTHAITMNLYRASDWGPIKAFSQSPTLLFLDPPREGFEQLDAFLNEFPSIKHIFYVSCNLSTFIRDAKFILKHGFQVCEVQPVDMFPNTPHIEICSYFNR